MGDFLVECRLGLATPGVPAMAVVFGIGFGVQAHKGFPVDVFTALVVAGYTVVYFVPILVMTRKIPWVRRRWDKTGEWGALMRDSRPFITVQVTSRSCRWLTTKPDHNSLRFGPDRVRVATVAAPARRWHPTVCAYWVHLCRPGSLPCRISPHNEVAVPYRDIARSSFGLQSSGS